MQAGHRNVRDTLCIVSHQAAGNGVPGELSCDRNRVRDYSLCIAVMLVDLPQTPLVYCE